MPVWLMRAVSSTWEVAVFDMLDVVYLVATVAFFALMLAFVRGLKILGRESDGAEQGGGGTRP